MFEYLHEKEHYIYARRHISKLQYTYFLVNYCEDLYSADELLRSNSDTYLLHSKSVYLSDSLRSVVESFSRVLDRPATLLEIGPSLPSLLPLLHSGELDARGLERATRAAVENKMVPPKSALLPSSWREAYPGKVYIWSTDFHAGPISCQIPVFREAGAVVHAEVDFGNCEYVGYCRSRLRVLSYDDWRGFALESGGRSSAALKKLFYKKYREDPEFGRIDAFVCSHPVANW